LSRPLLLDINVLIALTHSAHVHHALVQDWVQAQGKLAWSSCTVTQLGFVRLAGMPAIGGANTSPAAALALLDQLLAHPGHHFWPDAQGIANSEALRSPLIVGHRQVTDGYLLGLAMREGSALVTLDRGLASVARAMQAERHVHWIGPAGGGETAHEPAASYRTTKRRAR
jgi:toxin-antitoxin system PIN domain toxin